MEVKQNQSDKSKLSMNVKAATRKPLANFNQSRTREFGGVKLRNYKLPHEELGMIYDDLILCNGVTYL